MSFPFGTAHLQWSWLVVASFIGGLMNAVAGGGSFLVFPAMLNTGILPIQANATNTVALWPGQLTSIAAYREHIARHLGTAIPMGIAGLIGGTGGAILLLHTPQSTFMHLVPWLLLVAALIFAVSGPVSGWIKRRAGRAENAPPHPMAVVIITAVVCFYIGYFGAGAGFVIITTLSLLGFKDMHEINSLKVVSTTAANGTAFAIFVLNGQVVWRFCVVAMVAAAIGGYLSARLAKHIPQVVLRSLVVVIGLTMAAWFFWKNGRA